MADLYSRKVAVAASRMKPWSDPVTKPLTPKALVAPLNQVEAACKACHQEFRDY